MKSVAALAATVMLLLGAQHAVADVVDAKVAKNVTVRATLPESAGAISVSFIDYHGRDVALVSSTEGLATYDVSDLGSPRLLDRLTKSELALPGDDVAEWFWQNEDMEVDPARKLVFMARERGTFGDVEETGTYIVSAADPENLSVVTYHPQLTGHTTSCVNACQYLWTAGITIDYTFPSPIWVTDLRDPAHPVTSPLPVDLRGTEKSPHDVQVDAAGVAWVTGLSGTHGYWTSGRHLDPVLGIVREATAWAPIPYGGGKVPLADMPSTYSHNAFRPIGARLDDGPQPTPEHPAGSLLLHTEESFGETGTCRGQGKFVISSLQGVQDGKFGEMRTVGTWQPDGQEGDLGNVDRALCSAHYFDVSNRIVAQSYYQQGTRFLDISNPAHPVQIGYYRPDNALSWQPYWHRGSLFVADRNRGVEILSLTRQKNDQREVHAPPVQLRPMVVRKHDVYGYGCPMIVGCGGREPCC